jgi:oligopeptide/dipeptide ABC transporter ATP-binding protein
MSILAIEDLSVSVGGGDARVDIVRDVSLVLERGKILGLVGESGSGKSMTSLAAMGLLPKPGPRISAGRVVLDGVDVTVLEPWQRVEAGHGAMSMIFQEPMTSLNPVRRVGDQIVEAIKVRERLSSAQAEDRARQLLEQVRIPDAQLQLSAFPHQLSGGMRQRVMIAIALAGRPQVLIADEPTTALDVTVQFQILGLLRELCDTLQMAMLFITHDMGVIAQLADRVAVMYAGRVVETASARELFASPSHPYSRALMACMPIRGVGAHRLRTIPGQAPRPGSVRTGCSFAERCQDARDVCRAETPPLAQLAQDHQALCAFPVTDGRPL